MKITAVDSWLLCIPSCTSSPSSRGALESKDRYVVLARLATDSDHHGLGFASCPIAGFSVKHLVDHEVAPLLIGQDPLLHGTLDHRISTHLQQLRAGAFVNIARSLADIALWDLKGKVAGMPLYQLLGGGRPSAPVYAASLAGLSATAEQILQDWQARPAGTMIGLKIEVGSGNPEADAERVSLVREALGEEVWLGVDAGERYDYATALSMGHFFEEEMGVDSFEEPIPCTDRAGYARLAERLEVPIAVGATFAAVHEFHDFLTASATGVLIGDVNRVGGITDWLQVAQLARTYHCPFVPHRLPEVATHLACAFPEVRAVEYVPSLAPLFSAGPSIDKGTISPPPGAGLGLDVCADALREFSVRQP